MEWLEYLFVYISDNSGLTGPAVTVIDLGYDFPGCADIRA